MNDTIRKIAMELDSQMNGGQTINGNLKVDEIKIIHEFVTSYNNTIDLFPFPLKRR
jgi:hypothetical protein